MGVEAAILVLDEGLRQGLEALGGAEQPNLLVRFLAVVPNASPCARRTNELTPSAATIRS